MNTWQIKEGLLSVRRGRPLIMGILNVTPDSFSDGGMYNISADVTFERLLALAGQGADIIDIGGQSTRPGHVAIGAQEEWERIAPVFEIISRHRDILPPVSIDTYYYEVARKALECGAGIINDVTGLDLPEMRRLTASTGCGCVIMHHDDITACSAPVEAVRDFFALRVKECLQEGIKPAQIVLDVGIGFGKTREQEFELIRRCGECAVWDLPVLVGASRKRVTAWLMEQEGAEDASSLPPDRRDPATHRLHSMAAASGAQVIRVHDVSGAIKNIS